MKQIKREIKQEILTPTTSARIRVRLSRPAAAVMDELQDVLDGGELRPGGGGGLPGEESEGGHLAVGLLTRHGSGLLRQSLLTDLSGEAGDDVGGRAGGSSQEHFLTGGKV